jgi:hypothetical protein
MFMYLAILVAGVAGNALAQSDPMPVAAEPVASPEVVAPNPVTPSAPLPVPEPVPNPPPIVPVVPTPTTTTTLTPATTLWLPFEREAPMHADGASALCEGVLLPLLIIPGVSDVASIVTDLACIIPSTLALDHWAIHHGGRNAHTWQAVTALLTRRIVQTILELPELFVLGGGIFAGVAASGAVLAVYPNLPTSSAFAMIAIGGLLGYGILNVVSDEVGDLLFSTVYRGLTDVVSIEEQAELKKNAWIVPPHQGFVAWYSTLSLLAGSKPEFDFGQLIPVTGAWQKTHDKAVVQKERLHRFALEDLHSDRHDWGPVDGAIDGFAHVSGALMGTSHVLFIAALGTLVTSTIIAGNPNNKLVAETVGWGGIGVAGLGALTLVGSALTTKLEPFVVGAMYEATREDGARAPTTPNTGVE